jgi:methanogenic corrinoid protein MtbC1
LINVQRHPFAHEGKPPGRRVNLRFSTKTRSTAAHAALSRAIQVEVIPRIVLARRSRNGYAAARGDGQTSFGPHIVAEFASLCLAHEVDVLLERVDAMRARGFSLECIYLDLFSAAARCLEERGSDNLFDRAEATIGLGRLQRLLHALNPAFESGGNRRWNGRYALIMPAPGEQTTFDLFMIPPWLRRAGWEIVSWPLISHAEFFEVVRCQRFDLVWLEASEQNRIEVLSANIRRLRRLSQNPDIGVMVGGPLFVKQPELVALVGADATAVDGRQAAMHAQNLIDLLPSATEDRAIPPAASAFSPFVDALPDLETENAAE